VLPTRDDINNCPDPLELAAMWHEHVLGWKWITSCNDPKYVVIYDKIYLKEAKWCTIIDDPTGYKRYDDWYCHMKKITHNWNGVKIIIDYMIDHGYDTSLYYDDSPNVLSLSTKYWSATFTTKDYRAGHAVDTRFEIAVIKAALLAILHGEE